MLYTHYGLFYLNTLIVWSQVGSYVELPKPSEVLRCYVSFTRHIFRVPIVTLKNGSIMSWLLSATHTVTLTEYRGRSYFLPEELSPNKHIFKESILPR